LSRRLFTSLLRTQRTQTVELPIGAQVIGDKEIAVYVPGTRDLTGDIAAVGHGLLKRTATDAAIALRAAGPDPTAESKRPKSAVYFVQYCPRHAWGRSGE
jgi:hypothetical protein